MQSLQKQSVQITNFLGIVWWNSITKILSSLFFFTQLSPDFVSPSLTPLIMSQSDIRLRHFVTPGHWWSYWIEQGHTGSLNGPTIHLWTFSPSHLGCAKLQTMKILPFRYLNKLDTINVITHRHWTRMAMSWITCETQKYVSWPWISLDL